MNAVRVERNDALDRVATVVNGLVSAVEGSASIPVHNAVDETVSALLGKAQALGGLITIGRAAIKALNDIPIVTGQYVDPDDKIIDNLEMAANSYAALLSRYIAKKNTIDGDERLHESHCDMLHTAYDELLNCMANMVETAKDIRAALITRDMKAEPASEERYPDVESLVAAIRAA